MRSVWRCIFDMCPIYRHVGELALSAGDHERIRISTVDFWGNREETIVPLGALLPPFTRAIATLPELASSQVLTPLELAGL